MGVNRQKGNVAYGLTNALQALTALPIISTRNPGTTDNAELGTLWVNKNTDGYFIATSTTAGATHWEAQVGGTGAFASVDVTGAVGTTLTVAADSSLTGDLAVGGAVDITGNLNVGGDATFNGDLDITSTAALSMTSTSNTNPAIYLHANGGVLETIDIHSSQSTELDSIQLHSELGGILVESVGKVAVNAINLVADAGGIKLDAALTSTTTVTGAGQDIEFNTIGGSIHAIATEASATAISLTASDAAGKVAILGAGGVTVDTTNTAFAMTTGTGAINIGTDASAKTITLGNNTGATSVVVNAGTAGAGSINVGTAAHAIPITIGNVTGATGITLNSGTNGVAVNTTGAGDIVLTSADTVLIDAAGVLELNSSAGIISIGNDAIAQDINLGTGAAARAITIGNDTGATSVTIKSGANDITISSTDAVLLDAAGLLELNSSAGVINIGNDVVNQAVNMGTAGERTVTVGSATGASATAINCGTAGVSVGTSANAHITTVGSTTAACTLVLQTPAGTPVSAANGVSITTAAAGVTLPGPVVISSGAGVPANGLALHVGDLYINTTAASAVTRLYIATGVGAWTNVTCAA